MTAETATKERSAAAADGTPAHEVTSVALSAPIRAAPVQVIDATGELPAFIRERDDEAMLAAFMGEVVSQWFYEFEIGGKSIEGVGVVGADEFSRIQAERGCPITVVPYGVQIVETTRNEEKGVVATIVMRDARTRRESIGTAFYPYYTKNRKGERKFDDKADRKALSVAKRNAILDLVPQAEVLAVLKERKRLIAENEARLTEDRSRAIEHRHEVKSLPSGPAPTEIKDPYTHPSPTPSQRGAGGQAVGARASEEQVARILQLADDPIFDNGRRERIQEKLKKGVQAKVADSWIDLLVMEINANTSAGAADAADDSQLPL